MTLQTTNLTDHENTQVQVWKLSRTVRSGLSVVFDEAIASGDGPSSAPERVVLESGAFCGGAPRCQRGNRSVRSRKARRLPPPWTRPRGDVIDFDDSLQRRNTSSKIRYIGMG